MKYFFLITLVLVFITTCKKKEEDEQGQIDYNATVLKKGDNCGNSYLIKFDNDVMGLVDNTANFVYNEINLYDIFKEDNLRLKVTFREPTEDERLICIGIDAQYPQVFILSATD